MMSFRSSLSCSSSGVRRHLCYLFAAVLAVGVLVPVSGALAQKELAHGETTRAEDLQRLDPIMVLTVGKAEIVELEGAVSDIMVADPDIVDVVALQANRMYMVGAKVGNTNVMALDASGNVIKRMTVHVRIDDREMENTIHELFPDEDVRAQTVNEQVILIGSVSNPTVASQIRDIALRFVESDKNLVNMLKVSGEQQVMLKVRIMEASRTVLKEFGLETTTNEGLASTGGKWTLGSSATTRTGLTEAPFGMGHLLYDTGLPGIGTIDLLLNALDQDNLVNTLAEPNLTAVSGEEASFLAGGEFPVPVGLDSSGNIRIEFKPFGVSLNFRPTVLSEERIALQMKTEVSALDEENGITLDTISVPGLDVRRAQTVVEMNSGGSLMIAGLLKSDTIKGLSGMPGSRDVPIIGRLISSDSFQREETEVLIVVTPYVVQPIASPDRNVREVELAQTLSQPLQDVFSSRLKEIYGDRVPQLPGAGEPFGYLIN